LGVELWRVNAVDEFGHVTAEQLGNGIATSGKKGTGKRGRYPLIWIFV